MPLPPASPSPELAKVLALQITPGSIALLVEHGAEPAAVQRLQDALKDARPGVRTVAARVSYTAGLRMLLPSLRAALKAEQDPYAGAEELRALLTFAPVLAKEAVDASVRLGGPVATEAVDTFARLNSPVLLTYLATLEHAHASRARVREALKVLVDGDASLRGRLLQEFPSDMYAVSAALASVQQAGDQPSDEVLVGLLKSGRPVGLVTAWYLARAVAAGVVTLTPAVNAALEPMLTDNATAVTWDAFTLELLGRAAHHPRHERRWNTLADEQGPRPFWNDREMEREDRRLLGPLLSQAEAHDLAEVLHLPSDLLTKPALNKSKPPNTPDDFLVRTVPPLTDGLWSDVLKLTGCKATTPNIALANAAYRPDGRPRLISVMPNGLMSEPCARAARTLFMLSIAHDARPLPSSYSEGLLLPLEPAQVACVDDATASRKGLDTGAVQDEGARHATITSPKRTRMVEPIYPPTAQRDHVEGVVVIESVISRTGCMSEGTVTASPDGRLSGNALVAVMQWHYTPTLLGDQVVPTVMTVTVNFTLR